MGNRIAKLKSKRDISVLLLGLDNSGKTTLLQNLANEPIEEDQIPTVGYESRRFTRGRYRVLLMDVGGGVNIRSIWPNYFAESHAIIYVVDASDNERFQESKEQLNKVLMDHRVTCKPLLILCNKADKKEDGAEADTGVVDIMQSLDLRNLLSQSKGVSPRSTQPKTRLWLCSAIKKSGRGKGSDERLRTSFDWLLKKVSEHWSILSPRVNGQHGVELRQREAEKRERLERRRKRREEEEREALIAEGEKKGLNHHPHAVVQPTQSLSDIPLPENEIINVVAEIEKGNNNSKPKGPILNPFQSSVPISLSQSPIPNPSPVSAHNEGYATPKLGLVCRLEPITDQLKSYSTNTLPTILQPIVNKSSSEVGGASTGGKTVKWSVPDEEGVADSSSLRLLVKKAALPPIHITPPTESTTPTELMNMTTLTEPTTPTELTTPTEPTAPTEPGQANEVTVATKPLTPPTEMKGTAPMKPPRTRNDLKNVGVATIDSMGTSSVTSHGDINETEALPTLGVETRPLTVEDKDVNPPRPLTTKEKKWIKPKLIMKLRKKNKTYPINEDTPTVGGASISTGSWMARGEEPLKNTPSQEEGAGLASSSQNGMEAGHLPLVISTNHPSGKSFLLPQDTVVS